MNQLIVARYNEDISWLDKWRNTFDIIIYNKGDKIKNTKLKVIDLPNYGREAHTYLKHIVYNYEKLSNVTVFIQAKIDDVEMVNWVFSDLNTYIFTAISCGYGANSMGIIKENQWFIDFTQDPKYKKEIENGYFRLSDISLQDYVKKYLGHIPIIAPISLKGCFSVRKDRILSRPKFFYEDLLNSIPNHNTPEEAHFLERMWAYIFLEK